MFWFSLYYFLYIYDYLIGKYAYYTTVQGFPTVLLKMVSRNPLLSELNMSSYHPVKVRLSTLSLAIHPTHRSYCFVVAENHRIYRKRDVEDICKGWKPFAELVQDASKICFDARGHNVFILTTDGSLRILTGDGKIEKKFIPPIPGLSINSINVDYCTGLLYGFDDAEVYVCQANELGQWRKSPDMDAKDFMLLRKRNNTVKIE